MFYFVSVWTKDQSEQMLIAFSSVPVFQFHLPAGNNPTFTLNIIIHVRDLLDCKTEANTSSVSVIPDVSAMNNLMNDLQNPSNQMNTNPIVKLLASGNQNIVRQVIASVSQQLNQMNTESLTKAMTSRLILNFYFFQVK